MMDMRKIIEDHNGKERFKPNRIVMHLISTSSVDYNAIWELYRNEMVSLEELQEFYQLVGYTVVSYKELFGSDKHT